MINKHREIFKIKTYDIDFKKGISLKAILGFLEETATCHGKEMGYSYLESMKEGIYWVLRSAKIEFFKRPKFDDVIEIYTWPAGIQGVKVLRKFELFMNGVLIGRGYHYWIMLSIKKMKPIIYQKFSDSLIGLPSELKDNYRIKKIKRQTNLNYAYKKEVMLSDLDSNNHVNNVKYSDIIYNAIPTELLYTKEIIDFQIDYLKECKLGDKIGLFYKLIDDSIFIEGRKDDESMFKSIIKMN